MVRKKSEAKISVHVTAGPNNPTKATLAFFVAKTVLEDGHELLLFIAGGGVYMLPLQQPQRQQGLGTGLLQDHFAVIRAASGVKGYFSGMAAKARNKALEQVALSGAQPAMPTKLVQLTLECDPVLSY